jgi:hypothetical protein
MFNDGGVHPRVLSGSSKCIFNSWRRFEIEIPPRRCNKNVNNALSAVIMIGMHNKSRRVCRAGALIAFENAFCERFLGGAQGVAVGKEQKGGCVWLCSHLGGGRSINGIHRQLPYSQSPDVCKYDARNFIAKTAGPRLALAERLCMQTKCICREKCNFIRVECRLSGCGKLFVCGFIATKERIPHC